MKAISLLSTVFLILTCAPSALAFFRLAPAVLVQERADPIISPGGISGHVHSVTGGYNFGTSLSYEILQASQCTSTPVVEDKSAYWTPMPYFWAKNGSMYPINADNIGQQIYYGFKLGSTQAFPAGFRMIAGNPMARTYKPIPNNPKKRQIVWQCLRYSDNLPNIDNLHNFPTEKCPDGVRANLYFPTCSDGRLDSEDHTSHMMYENEDGSCPSTHNKARYSELHYELYWTNVGIDWAEGMNPEQPFVLSHGDPTGYGFHGDGWDEGVLQRALDDCDGADGDNKGSGEPKTCKHFTIQDGTAMGACNKRDTPSPDLGNGEVVHGWLDKLPGCNPITFNEEDATADGNCKVGSGKDGFVLSASDKAAMLAGPEAAKIRRRRRR